MPVLSDVEIVNPVPLEDATALLRTLRAALLQDPYPDDFAHRLARWSDGWNADRTWAARHDGRIVGTLATDPRLLTVPAPGGGTTELATDALTAVSVAATHRRRGLLTWMITAALRDARERGDALAILIAAEWAIYGRYGYAPATRRAGYTYRPRERGATVTGDPEGQVRQIEAGELVEYAPAIFDRARRQWVGQIDRPGNWWRRALDVGFEPVGPRHQWFVHEGPDGPDGLLSRRATRDADLDGSHGAITVPTLVAASELAYRNLWAYLGGIDLVDEIELEDRPVDEPARWLMPNGRALRQQATTDFLWLAILDVPTALGRRGYATSGRLVLEVVDDSPGGYAAGRFQLDATPDGASCVPSSANADLRLPARALAAAYLGGHSLHTLRLAGGVDEHSPGAVERLDAMLRTGPAPWCQTWF